MKVISGENRQHYRPALNKRFSLALIQFIWISRMFVQLRDQKKSTKCHDTEIYEKFEQRASAFALKRNQEAKFEIAIEIVNGKVDEHCMRRSSFHLISFSSVSSHERRVR
jgi:hypothetical protein